MTKLLKACLAGSSAVHVLLTHSHEGGRLLARFQQITSSLMLVLVSSSLSFSRLKWWAIGGGLGTS